jgi:hypothetical protein
VLLAPHPETAPQSSSNLLRKRCGRGKTIATLQPQDSSAGAEVTFSVCGTLLTQSRQCGAVGSRGSVVVKRDAIKVAPYGQVAVVSHAPMVGGFARVAPL